jgi:hypothetical protein
MIIIVEGVDGRTATAHPLPWYKLIFNKKRRFYGKKYRSTFDKEDLKMQLLPLYESHFQQSLTNVQYQTLKILIWLLTVQKTVRIERLAACFPLPITYESRRKHIQRFLTLSSLSLPLFWFPIAQLIIQQEFQVRSGLIITLDRTQWKNNNVLVIKILLSRSFPYPWDGVYHEKIYIVESR